MAKPPKIPEDTEAPETLPQPVAEPETVVEKVANKVGFSWKQVNWLRVARDLAIGVVAIAVLLSALLLGLNTPPGRRLLIEFATGIKMNSGLKFQIDRIDGSLYGDMTLHGVRVLDTKGVFVKSDLIHLNWRPFGALFNHVDIRDLTMPGIEIMRQPVLNPSQNPEKPKSLLPGIDIDINHLQIDRLQIDAAVAGQPYVLKVSGSAHTRKKRAQITADASSDKGDNAHLALNAVPDDNKLDIDASVTAPKGGVIAGLAHLPHELDASLTGKGSWQHWDGRLQSHLDGNPIINLGVTGRNGVFALAGAVNPDRFLDGPSAAILKPQVNISGTAQLKNRDLQLDLALASDAMSVTTKGSLDLGNNHFDKLELHARLLKPQVLGSDFSAADLRADLIVDGGFNTPRVDYDIAAKRFGLGKIDLTGLEAQGRSHADGGKIVVPLKVRLTSLTGLGPQVDPLLTHLKLDGNLTLAGATLTSDTLHLSSDRLKASGTVKGDVSKSTYAAAVKASLNKYRLDGLATANVATDVKLTYNKALAVAGTANLNTTKIENDGLAKFLGGNVKASMAYAYAPNGTFSVTHLKATAPQFQISDASGAISQNGGVALKAVANSKQYGPLDAVVSGTLATPHVILHAKSPGLGVQIHDVTATIDGAPGGYAITANGGSAYGPFSADTFVAPNNGHGQPLTIDIHQAQFASITTVGRIVQTPQGPFAGTLSLNGSGLTGTAVLSALNGDQAAMLNANGNNIDLPGDLKVHAGRAIIAASVVLKKEAEINADVQMADLRYGTMSLSTGRAKIALIGQNGTIKAVLRGGNGLPADIAINGVIAPNQYTIAAQGQVNSLAFHLDHPARISHQGADWVLAPVKLVMNQGTLDVAGRFGDSKTAQLRLHDLDLSVINLFAKDLGVGGTANGAVDFRQSGNAFPLMRANLTIARFSRASAAVASTPVDMDLDAALSPDRTASANYVHALIRQGNAVVGRVQLALNPANSGDWIADVNNAQVSGGIRYNGQAGVPFSLAGLPRQQLSGPIALAADVSGQLNTPRLNGVIKAQGVTYDNDAFGTRISDITLDGRFTNDRLELTSFASRAGEGTVKGSGWLSLSAAQHFPMQIHADLKNARLARSDQINSVVSGTFDVTNNATDGALIAGDLRLPSVKYTFVKQGAAEVVVLDGVRRKGDIAPGLNGQNDALPAYWKLNISARADNQIFVSGMGLDSEWSMRMKVTGTTRDPIVVGEVKAIRGNYTFAGRAFDIDNGTITFDGGTLTNPEIALQASASISDVEGIIKVTGTAQKPQIAFSSSPSLPQDEILSRMLFGQSVANISATEALQLASAVNGLNGGTDYLNPLGALRSATGIDRLRVVGADTTTGRGTSLAAGKYLTSNVYVEVVTDTKGFTATQLEIALGRSLSILSQVGNAGTAASIRYSKDY